MTVTGLAAVRFGCGMREPVTTTSWLVLVRRAEPLAGPRRGWSSCAKAGVAMLAAPQMIVVASKLLRN